MNKLVPPLGPISTAAGHQDPPEALHVTRPGARRVPPVQRPGPVHTGQGIGLVKTANTDNEPNLTARR